MLSSENTPHYYINCLYLKLTVTQVHSNYRVSTVFWTFSTSSTATSTLVAELTPCWFLSGPSPTPAHPGKLWMGRGTWPAQTEPTVILICRFIFLHMQTKKHMLQVRQVYKLDFFSYLLPLICFSLKDNLPWPVSLSLPSTCWRCSRLRYWRRSSYILWPQPWPGGSYLYLHVQYVNQVITRLHGR